MSASLDAATKNFIRKARAIHGSRYDYSRSVFKGSETKLKIICPEHGAFLQTPYVHTCPRLRCGCKKCGNSRSGTAKKDSAAKAFVSRASKMHGNRYDYSKVRYDHAHAKVCIICPLHGEFAMTANCHLQGQGCPRCGADRRGRQKREDAAKVFIAKAQKVHGRKYDYSQTAYFKASHKVTIICSKHGPFLQRPNNHLRGVGCPACKSDTIQGHFTKGFKQFVRDARAVHGRKFQYTGEYVNRLTPLTIACPSHGKFLQKPANHLTGVGCPKCAQDQRNEAITMGHAEFVRRARAIHRSKGFTYPELYQRTDWKIDIKCPRHGIFRQTPNNHLHGYGCPRCQADASSKRQRISHAAFVTKARKVHGHKYSYPQQYQTAVIPITILCKKHGGFRQIPNSHLAGNGCPACRESSGERGVAQALDALKIAYARQKGFASLRDIKPLRFDFFLPDQKTFVEFDGIQHFQSIEHWGGEESHTQTLRRDRIKARWAKRHGYRLIRIPYTESDVKGFLADLL